MNQIQIGRKQQYFIFNFYLYNTFLSKKAITPTTANWSQVDSVKSNPFKYDLTKKSEENL